MAKVSIKRHLKELQWRLMIVAGFFIIGAVVAYQYRDTLINLLMSPLHGEKLVYLTPGGGFSFIFMVTIYAGIAVAFPVLIHQLYGFLKPVLPAKIQNKSTIIIISSFALMIAGIVFGYLVAVPNALVFLYSFAGSYVDASLTAESYLSFVVAYTIGIGLTFQVPLLLLFIHAVKPLSPGGLMKSERWVILGAFVAAAIITPTVDPVNQAVIAGPIIVVYQIGVIAIMINVAKTRRIAKKALKQQSRREVLKDHAAPQRAVAAEARADIATKQRPLASHAVASVAQMPQQQADYEALLDESLTDLIEDRQTSDIHMTQAIEAEVIARSQPKVIDGFVRRPAGQLQIPQRPKQPLRPQARPVVRPQEQPQVTPPATSRGFYVDGIIGTNKITA